MARDYSSRRNNPPPKNGKRKPAKRASPAAKPVRKKATRSRGAPAAVWLLSGLFIGVTVAAGFYIFARPAGTPGHQQVSIDLPNGEPDKKTATPAPGTAQAAHQNDEKHPEKAEAKPRFSFYKMLPNYKVEVTDEQQRSRTHASHSAPHDVEPDDNTPTPSGNSEPTPSQAPVAQDNSSQGNDNQAYVIQAGAFSTDKDADRRKAQLALLGLSAQVIDIKLSSGKTVYRVQTDVIKSRARVDEFMRRLKKNDIEGLVMQARQ